jgi:hypothetical protein
MTESVDQALVQSFLKKRLDELQQHIGEISLELKDEKRKATTNSYNTLSKGQSISYIYDFIIDHKQWTFRGQRNTIGVLEITQVHIEIT